MKSGQETGVMFNNIVDQLPGSLALDVREDIAGDVVLSLVSATVPHNLKALMETYTKKNVKMAVQAGRISSKGRSHISYSELAMNRHGEITLPIFDETSLIPFEERFVVEVD
jgi:hypothetical protein